MRYIALIHEFFNLFSATVPKRSYLTFDNPSVSIVLFNNKIKGQSQVSHFPKRKLLFCSKLVFIKSFKFL